VKQLKQLLSDLGIKSDDCFEKSEMIERIQSFASK